jgi:hypothetical protein
MTADAIDLTGTAGSSPSYAIHRFGLHGHNITHWAEYDTGGHFAALEALGVLTADIRHFYRTLR